MAKQVVIDQINAVLPLVSKAMAQDKVHAQTYRFAGYICLKHKLHGYFYDEHHHSKMLLNRLLFLGGSIDGVVLEGMPDTSSDVTSMMAADVMLATELVGALNAAVKVAEANDDNGTAVIFLKILKCEEKHCEWLEKQQRLISVLGKQTYLSEKL